MVEINKQFLLPDLTFLLKVAPKVCLERIKQNRFSIELFEKEEVLEKVWQNYEKLSKEFENVYIINGELSPKKVFEQIKTIISNKL